MEAFASLPQDLTDRSLNNDDRHPQSYLSLSQFDIELQQQAQLAMQQEIEAWQDFENYLPPVEYVNAPNAKIPSTQVRSHVTPDRRQSMMNGQVVDLAPSTNLSSLNNNVMLSQRRDSERVPPPAHSLNFSRLPIIAETWSAPHPAIKNEPQSVPIEYTSPKQAAYTSPVSESTHLHTPPFGSPESVLNTPSDFNQHHLQSPKHVMTNEQQTYFNPSAFSTPATYTSLETPLMSPNKEVLSASSHFSTPKASPLPQQSGKISETSW
jgi:hypothetical protein